MTELFGLIKEELELDNSKEFTTEGQKQWVQLTCITRKNIYLCVNGHDTTWKDNLLQAMKLPPALTLEESFQKYFYLESVTRKCWKCKEKK